MNGDELNSSQAGPSVNPAHQQVDMADLIQNCLPSGASAGDHAQAGVSHTASGERKRAFPAGLDSPADRTDKFWQLHSNGKDAYEGNSFEELTEKIAFLTSVVMETKNTQSTLAKRYKEERVFKKEGNKIQYNLNNAIMALLDDANFAVQYRELGNLKACLREAMLMLKDRNKVIVIADQSEFGWATVSAYQTCDAALNEDDDRRIRRAETVARTQQRLRLQQATARGRGRGARGRGGRGAYGMPAFPHYMYPTPNPYHMMQQGQAPMVPQGYAPPKPLVRCYSCGGFGHYKNACPAPQPTFAYAAPAAAAPK